MLKVIHDIATEETTQIDLTQEEINELQNREDQYAKIAYRDKRRNEYPSFIDYLDGIVKGDAAQVQSYIDACLAVKAKYPKPL